MNFFELLQSIQNRQQSLLCIALDTDPSLLPPHLGSTPQAVLEFNREVIKATCDFVCAYKMNLAFYDALGKNGWDILRETLNLIPPEILTIGDGKRADIGNTSEQYARALFHDLGFNAITANPYMGSDSLEPFLQDEARGVFVLSTR